MCVAHVKSLYPHNNPELSVIVSSSESTDVTRLMSESSDWTLDV